MPSADRYARYRADQTTIWVSKRAAEFLARERATTGESTSAALDRLLGEIRSSRKGAGGGGAAKSARGATKSAGKSATKSATKSAGKSATKSAAKGGAKSAARGGRSAAKAGSRAGARSRGTA